MQIAPLRVTTARLGLGAYLVSVYGELDIETAPTLERELEGISRLGGRGVVVDGETVQLTPSEFRVLTLLAEQPERVFSRREIMQHLWESSYVGDQRACDIHVSNIRRKIEADASTPRRLVTIRGVGYKLVAV